jgi:hypothetical protein
MAFDANAHIARDVVAIAPSAATYGYPIIVSAAGVRIGCNRLTWQQAAEFGERHHAGVDGRKAVRFARRWKSAIFAIGAAHGWCEPISA